MSIQAPLCLHLPVKNMDETSRSCCAVVYLWLQLRDGSVIGQLLDL